MNKIVLSAIATMTLGSALFANTITLYSDAAGNIYKTPGEGRTQMGDFTQTAKPEETKKEVSELDSFMKRFHFKNDMRLRYESVENTYFNGTEKNVYHTRYRLRLASTVDITENLKLNVGVRSGYGNPTSGNQTFLSTESWGDYFWDTLTFNIAGLTYTSDESTLKVGRHPYMMYRPLKSQLVWDNDISLDGINYQYNDGANMITIGANQTSLADISTSKKDKDINLYLAQYVRTTKIDSSKLNVGAGIYYYDGVKGNTSLYASNSGSSMGNTMVNTSGNEVSKNGVFVNDYQIAEAFGELKLKSVLGKPVAIAAGVAYNIAATKKNFGYDLAFQIGKAKEVKDWQLKYSYTNLQADAVLGAHSDSDNFGGGSAAKGHAIRTKYKYGKELYIAGTFFYNTRFASKDDKGGDTKYERVQIDAIIEF